jgi:hypothetical protein
MKQFFSEQLPDYANNSIMLGFSALILVEHFFLRTRDRVLLGFLFFLIFAVTVTFIGEAFTRAGVLLLQLVALIIIYGSSLYVVICDIMLIGMANRPTLLRGGK